MKMGASRRDFPVMERPKQTETSDRVNRYSINMHI